MPFDPDDYARTGTAQNTSSSNSTRIGSAAPPSYNNASVYASTYGSGISQTCGTGRHDHEIVEPRRPRRQGTDEIEFDHRDYYTYISNPPHNEEVRVSYGEYAARIGSAAPPVYQIPGAWDKRIGSAAPPVHYLPNEFGVRQQSAAPASYQLSGEYGMRQQSAGPPRYALKAPPAGDPPVTDIEHTPDMTDIAFWTRQYAIEEYAILDPLPPPAGSKELLPSNTLTSDAIFTKISNEVSWAKTPAGESTLINLKTATDLNLDFGAAIKTLSKSYKTLVTNYPTGKEFPSSELWEFYSHAKGLRECLHILAPLADGDEHTRQESMSYLFVKMEQVVWLFERTLGVEAIAARERERD